MVQEEQIADSAQASQLVQWLEEQRKLDKDHLIRVQQDLERLALRLNELVAQVQQIGDDAKLERSHLATIPFAEEGIRQLREQLSLIQKRVDEREQSQERDAMLRQVEIDRDKKTLFELVQQISELSRQDEQQIGKIQMLFEDVRRGRADLAAAVDRVDAAEKFASSVSSRTQLLEEYVRRYDGRIAALEQAQEMLKTDSARFLQWQQAADLRWTRQSSEWQEHMDEWKREADDQVKAVQLLSRQFDQLKNEILELRNSIGESHKRIEDQSAELLRMASIRAHDREDNSRLEQALDVQRRRSDEQSDTLKVLQEQLLRSSQEFIELGARLESERKRVDESSVWFRQIEMKQQQTVDEIAELHRLLREQNQALAEQTRVSQRQLDELAHKWEQQVAEIHQLVEQQKVREAAELERQLLEIRDRMNKYKGLANL